MPIGAFGHFQQEAIMEEFEVSTIGNEGAPSGGRRRPIGVVLTSLVLLLSGLLLSGPQLYALNQAYSESQGPVTLSGPYVAMLVGDGLLSVTSVCSAVGLLIGAKWGWCLAGLHWTWRLGREAVVPLLANALWSGSSSHVDDGVGSKEAVRLAFVCLMLLYLFRGNVISYFRLDALNKLLALTGLCVIGFSLALILDPREGPLGSILEEGDVPAGSHHGGHVVIELM